MATIIVADDQSASREATGRVLRETGHRVVFATDGQDALARVETEKPDVLILDVLMPRVDGLEVCRRLKESRELFLPVLFLSGRADLASRLAGFQAGADDFLGKPYDADELRARVAVLVRTKQRMDDLVRQKAQLEDFTIQDPLTGVYDQRYLTHRLEEEFRRSRRYNEALSVIALDLDQFEQVNSRFGRGVGDRLLRACGRAIQAALSEVDVAARAGADEFVVILPNTHFAGSIGVAERIWHHVAEATVEENGQRVGCPASLGVSFYPGRDTQSATELLRVAHAALARAKAEGRGKICLYQHQGYLFQPGPR